MKEFIRSWKVSDSYLWNRIVLNWPNLSEEIFFKTTFCTWEWTKKDCNHSKIDKKPLREDTGKYGIFFQVILSLTIVRFCERRSTYNWPPLQQIYLLWLVVSLLYKEGRINQDKTAIWRKFGKRLMQKKSIKKCMIFFM